MRLFLGHKFRQQLMWCAAAVALTAWMVTPANHPMEGLLINKPNCLSRMFSLRIKKHNFMFLLPPTGNRI